MTNEMMDMIEVDHLRKALANKGSETQNRIQTLQMENIELRDALISLYGAMMAVIKRQADPPSVREPLERAEQVLFKGVE